MLLYYYTQLHSSASSSSSSSAPHLCEAVFTHLHLSGSPVSPLPHPSGHTVNQSANHFFFLLSFPSRRTSPPFHNVMQPSALLLAQRQRQMAALCSHRRAITPADTANPTWIRKVRQDVPGNSHMGTYNTTLLLQGSQFYCC